MSSLSLQVVSPEMAIVNMKMLSLGIIVDWACGGVRNKYTKKWKIDSHFASAKQLPIVSAPLNDRGILLWYLLRKNVVSLPLNNRRSFRLRSTTGVFSPGIYSEKIVVSAPLNNNFF